MDRFVKERVYKGGHMFTRGKSPWIRTGYDKKICDLREF